MGTLNVTNSFVDGTTINAADHNTNFADVETFVNAEVIHRDGAVPFTGNQSMGNKKLTDLATPTADNDAARKVYVDDVVAALPDVPDFGLVADIENVSASQAAGTSPKVARADHVHTIGDLDVWSRMASVHTVDGAAMTTSWRTVASYAFTMPATWTSARCQVTGFAEAHFASSGNLDVRVLVDGTAGDVASGDSVPSTHTSLIPALATVESTQATVDFSLQVKGSSPDATITFGSMNMQMQKAS